MAKKRMRCPECGKSKVFELGKLYYKRRVYCTPEGVVLTGEFDVDFDVAEGSPESYECDGCGFDDPELSVFLVEV